MKPVSSADAARRRGTIAALIPIRTTAAQLSTDIPCYEASSRKTHVIRVWLGTAQLKWTDTRAMKNPIIELLCFQS